jgi:DNA polymerase III subunit gamma/tau
VTTTSTGYQVLARKYRPQTFHDVVGQEAVVQTLMRALDSGRVAHAFLFTGSRGVGKTTLARILARCLVCEQGVSSSPDGTCNLCKGVAAGSLVDVVEIDGASNNSVEQVRDLQEVARYLPQLARFKIFIIDEVHMLSTSAFNALLKILEEPPPHVKFVFATTEPHKIPVTILSRCQRYDFRRIPMRTIVGRLKAVLAAEELTISEGGLDVIARAAEGGMRDALSLTDQVLSFAGGGATAEQVTDALGIIDRRSIVTAVEACIAGDAKAALGVVDNAWARGHDQRQLLAGIAEEFRHLSVAAATGSLKGFADLPDEEIARIDERSQQIDGRDLTRLYALALDGIDPVSKAEDPRLFVELVLLKMCGRPPLGDALAISEAIVRLEALAKGRPVPPIDPDRSPRPPGGARAPAAATSAAAPPTSGGTAARGPRAAEAPKASGAEPTSAETAAPPAHSPPPLAGSTPPRTAEPELYGEDPPPVAEVEEAPAERAAASVEAATNEDEEDEGLDPAAGLPLEGIDARFKDFVDSVARAHRPMGMHLDHAHMRGFEAGRLEVFFTREMHATALKSAVEAPVIKEALGKAFGEGTKLVLVAPPAEAAHAAPSIAEARERALAEAQRALEAHARSHPVVEKAVALFGGEVRAVRPRARS